MSDRYDKGINYLNLYPNMIMPAFFGESPSSAANSLFDFAGRHCIDNHGNIIGCIVTIKGGGLVAENETLTKAIRNDDRIPLRPKDINLNNLYIFAEWRRQFENEF